MDISVYVVLSSSVLIATIAPSFILLFLSGIIKSSSILYCIPNPLHSLHAPYGALNENILGSSSGSEKSQSGHAYFSLIKNSSFPTTSINTFPFDSLDAVSIDSYSLDLIPSFIISLSITTSILCFFVFDSSIFSDRSYSSPSILILTYPSFLYSSSKSLNVPFSPCITGAIILIFVFGSNFNT